MLDTDTKRRIDSARDILVGKVPDPKSQVEQITIALIYKFMDDMDAESEELGGLRSFFAGDFARYGWAKLMRSGLGGHETLNLYAEAISRMPENPGVPALFRAIFKNAYLPYRDPETLRIFLKVIDEFSYDHSERLGDAFEYLLSVLGSQGDAGQFRTPRHIIDFMVKILDPKKDEKVLDPACGTAGFLISSYKHILASNKDEKCESTLTPDEKGLLARNFTGYDISPDMVRLSLVNMYLHGFVDPHIYEYDTLTSQERWNDYADVILANPPFMSPKGGIRPHNRFSVQSKRSEVLFVDYMAEHLKPNGRAAIIVPEGIIFQSQNAYVQLRKMLVDDYLVAVVSLPAGVFNPYSGVKTSILILDKELAKHSSTIGFFKVENDGFGLGAQRREIAKNDLPEVEIEIGNYLHNLLFGQYLVSINLSHGLIVLKEKIKANGDYNFSGERYRENGSIKYSFPLVPLKDICEINPSKREALAMPSNTLVSFVPMSDLGEHRITFLPKETRSIGELGTSYTYFADGDVLLAKVTPCFENGKAGIAKNLSKGIGFGSSEFYVFRPNNKVLAEYIYFCVTDSAFREKAIAQMTGTGGLQRVPKSFVKEYSIPLPPLEIQKQIVAEIAGYQKVLDGARTVVDNYRPIIAIDPNWPIMEIGDIFKTRSGTTPSRSNIKYFTHGTIPWVKTLDLTDGSIITTEEKITKLALNETNLSILPVGTVLVAMYGGFNQIGRTGVLEIEATHNQAMTALLPNSKINPYFLNTILIASKDYWKKIANSTRKDPNITKSDVIKFKLPLPPLNIQEAIVAEIEAEQKLVDANRELIARFEKKIQAVLARVWGESDGKKEEQK